MWKERNKENNTFKGKEWALIKSNHFIYSAIITTSSFEIANVVNNYFTKVAIDI